MTPARLRACLAVLGWSGHGLARRLGLDERQIRRWVSGEYSVPADVAAWIELLASYHEAHPAPVR